jgi:hypothetical protein
MFKENPSSTSTIAYTPHRQVVMPTDIWTKDDTKGRDADSMAQSIIYSVLNKCLYVQKREKFNSLISRRLFETIDNTYRMVESPASIFNKSNPCDFLFVKLSGPGEGRTIFPTNPELEKDPLKIIQKEREFFIRNLKALSQMEEYKGKFVAMLRGEIIDHDEDNRKLAKRVYEKFGYIPIYIDKVEKKERIIEIPSPELK